MCVYIYIIYSFFTYGCKCVSVHHVPSTPKNMFTKQKRREGKYVLTTAKDRGPHEFPGVWRRPNLNTHSNTAWASLTQVTSSGSRKNKGWKYHLGNCSEIHSSQFVSGLLLNHGHHVLPANATFWAPNLQWGQGFQTEREVRGPQ